MTWNSFAKTSKSQEYYAIATFLPLRRISKIFKFIKYSREIQTQLSESKGLIGYGFNHKFLKKHFWTLSVWESEDALKEFVRKIPHSQTMKDLKPYMDEPKVVSWKITGSTELPTWEEAFKRLEED